MTRKFTSAAVVAALLAFSGCGQTETVTQTAKPDTTVAADTLSEPFFGTGSSRVAEENLPDGYDYTSVEYSSDTEFTSDTVSDEAMRRMADIKRTALVAMEAQLEGDLVLAEEHIIRALESVHSVLQDYPEVHGNRRFIELYRSVMAEYYEFYGINGPISEVEGDIFAVKSEMFAEDKWFEGTHYTFPDDIGELRTEFPLIVNEQVHNHIAFLTERRPEVMERWLERSQTYFPMMRRIFKEEGVPEELIHLSMIESGLVPVARSHMRAVGLWQFIYATGSAYGLEVNWWIDERRDPEKSTRAAARHLRDLYDKWDDWYMVLADYNASTRAIRRAMNRAGGSRDYWDIWPYLPRETRGYVPGYIAATIVAMNPEDFGFERPTGGIPYEYDVVPIEGSVNLDILAEFAGITTQELRDLNPELLRFATPPGSAPYPLKIPKGSKDEFIAAYSEMPEEHRQSLVIHSVRSGESLGVIANRYGVSVRALYAANEGLSNIIHPGQEIMIPVPHGSNVEILADTPSRARQASSASRQATPSTSPAPAGTAPVTYTVKSGDTVGHIAEWYNTQAWRVRSWNNIGNMIRVGQRLTLYVPAAQRDYFTQVNDMSRAQKQQMLAERRRSGIPENQVADSGSVISYTVRRNDNLSDIARAHNTTVSNIMQLNGLNNTVIRIGQQLQIPVGQR